MIKNKKAVLCMFMLVLSAFLSIIPQQVLATTSGYTCSDGDYDPMAGDSSSSPTLYYVEHQHNWGVCKNGTQPTSPLTADNKIAKNDACKTSFLGFPAWYRGLTNAGCDIVNPGSESGIDLSGFIWRIALNVVEMAMVAVAYVTVFFILYGGFQFLTSQGAPEGMAKAKTTITNAVIGLVISLVAVGLINYIVTGLLI